MQITIKKQSVAQDMAYISLFAVIIAICSWITIPSVVPFTLQTLGVFAAVGILGGKRGTAAVLVYILLGAVGIPVFAGFSGGIGVLLGSSGGYIVGFLFSALIMWGIEAFLGKSKLVLGISMIVGLAACYAVGTLWFMAVYMRTTGTVSLFTVLGWCVFPFILPDLGKIALALYLTGRIKKAVAV